MTNLTTLYFLETANTTMQFIKLIVEIFGHALEEYKKMKNITDKNDIVFIYKGGNALKAIFLEYMYENPGVVTDIIRQYFQDSFGKSDADFQIFINPHLPNYDEIFEDLSVLSYLLLNRIRNIFLKNVDQWLDFYKYKSEIAESIMQRSLKKLNDSHAVTSDDRSPYYHAAFLNLNFLDITVGEKVNLDEARANIIGEGKTFERFFNNFGSYGDRTTI